LLGKTSRINWRAGTPLNLDSVLGESSP